MLPRALLLLALLAMLGACHDDTSRASGTVSVPSVRPAVVAPDGVWAELRLARPSVTWTALRAAVGGPLQYLPHGATGALLTLLGLPIHAAGELDVERPLVGAARAAAHDGPGQAATPAELGFAVALKDGRRLVAQLTVGPNARHDARTAPDGALVWLERRAGTERSGWLRAWELGVLDDTMLVGSSREALERLGPYLATTLSRRSLEQWRAPPSSPTARAASPGAEPDLLLVLAGPALAQALPGALSSLLDAARKTTLGRVRTLGDAGAAQASALALLGGWTELRAAVSMGEASTRLEAQLRFREEVRTRLGALGTTAPTRLLELPADSILAVGWAEPREARVAAAGADARRIAQLLGPKGPADAEPMLREGLGGLARGRGEATVAGLRCSGVGLTGFAKSSVEDAKAVREGLAQLTKLRRNPTVVARLAGLGLRLGVRSLRLEGIALDVTGLRLTRAARAAAQEVSPAPAPAADVASTPEPVELLAAVDEQALWLAAGMDARETLGLLYRARDGASAAPPLLADVVARLPERAWLMLGARPLGLLGCGTATPEPDPSALLFAAVGPNDAEAGMAGMMDAWLRVEATSALLRAAAEPWDAAAAQRGR
jgi:hypothetical protein